MAKPAISLFFMPREAMLIVSCTSGVVYRNQVGGVVCRQAELEGVLAPVDLSDADLARIMGLPFAPISGITSALADAVDDILASAPRARYLKVDRTRLHESSEAWVFVVASTPLDPAGYQPPSDYFGSVFGFGEVNGVLTWPNSD